MPPLQTDDVEKVVSFAVNAKLPEWQVKLYTKHSNEIQVHSAGELFYKIDQLFPNEQPDSKAHRLLSFEPITKASYWKGITNVTEIFQNSSYIATASENTLDLIKQNNWDDKNFFSYFMEQWTHWQLGTDPNALQVVYPFDYVKENPGMDQCKFIHSDYIRHNQDGIFVFVSIDESDKTFSLEDVKLSSQQFFDPKVNRTNLKLCAENTYSQKLIAKVTRNVFHVFTSAGFYRIEQDKNDGKKYTWKFYPNKFPFVAAQMIGGVAGQDKLVKKSFFEVGVPMANLALLQHSQHTAVNSIYSFPRMSEIEIECENTECQSGLVVCDVSTEWPEGKKPCGRCHGTGYTTNQTPYKVYRKKLATDGMGDNKIMDQKMVEFYTPDVSILDYSKQEWKDYLSAMEEAIFVTQPVKTGNEIAAKSKEIDLKEKYSFLKRIAKVAYPKLRFAIQCYENYLNASPNEVSITTPYAFAIITEAEALETLNNILSSPAPVLVKANEIDLYISKFISQSSPVKKAFEVLKIVDKLFFYATGDITVFKSNGVATREQWITHAFAYPVMLEMYNKNKILFQEKTTDEIVELVKIELEPYLQEPDTSLKATIIKKAQQQ